MTQEISVNKRYFIATTLTYLLILLDILFFRVRELDYDESKYSLFWVQSYEFVSFGECNSLMPGIQTLVFITIAPVFIGYYFHKNNKIPKREELIAMWMALFAILLTWKIKASTFDDYSSIFDIALLVLWLAFHPLYIIPGLLWVIGFRKIKNVKCEVFNFFHFTIYLSRLVYHYRLFLSGVFEQCIALKVK